MKKRGKGISLVYYPTGMSGGGDTTQAFIKMKPDGGADLYVGSVDLGQGVKTIVTQIIAEELGIPVDSVVIHNQNTDVAGICTGTFASRVTYFAGNAVKRAAEDTRRQLFELAAPGLGVAPDQLAAGDGKIYAVDNPEKSITIADLCTQVNWGQGKIIVGTDYFWKQPSSYSDEENGQIDMINTLAFGTSLAEVEVDTDTGEVTVLKMINVFDAGKVINPLLAKGQVDGGVVMGLGSTLTEDLFPYYPDTGSQPQSLSDYIIPTTMDIPVLESELYECPSANGPYGAKGIGEMTNNTTSPAVVNAVRDAIGVWIDEIPLTPEKILRALEQAK